MVNKRIAYVEPGSLAQKHGISPGDTLISINGKDFYDILEYRFLISDISVCLEIQKENGEVKTVNINSDYEDIGIDFEEALIDNAKSCTNKCIFCFIDQLPKGMRETVYFKDDDTRLSFLQGNYVTLTNVSDEQLQRMIDMRVSPINISVHTTNPELRVKMLGNRFAGNIYERMKKLAENKIYMNCQIVLCYGINDKEKLESSLDDMAALYPYVESISVVPVGLTAYRDGLFPLEPFDKAKSLEVIQQVEALQQKYLDTTGTRLVYLSDEFYVKAGLPIPSSECYEGFPQIENGVGLISSMKEEFDDAISCVPDKKYNRSVSLVTGEASYEFIKSLADELTKRFYVKINVYPIKNEFFGGEVTVTGLLCGCDIIKQLKDKELGDCLIIPEVSLRDNDELFLDDTTLDDVRRELNVNISTALNDGYDFIEKILNIQIEF